MPEAVLGTLGLGRPGIVAFGRGFATVHAHSRLVGGETHPKGTQVTQEIQVNVVGQDRPALIYEMVVLYHPAMKRG